MILKVKVQPGYEAVWLSTDKSHSRGRDLGQSVLKLATCHHPILLIYFNPFTYSLYTYIILLSCRALVLISSRTKKRYSILSHKRHRIQLFAILKEKYDITISRSTLKRCLGHWKPPIARTLTTRVEIRDRVEELIPRYSTQKSLQSSLQRAHLLRSIHYKEFETILY